MYQYKLRTPGDAGKRPQMSPEFTALAHQRVMSRVKQQRPSWTTEMCDSVAWDIVRRIDWNNEALMHKSLEWMTDTSLNSMCPKE